MGQMEDHCRTGCDREPVSTMFQYYFTIFTIYTFKDLKASMTAFCNASIYFNIDRGLIKGWKKVILNVFLICLVYNPDIYFLSNNTYLIQQYPFTLALYKLYILLKG